MLRELLGRQEKKKKGRVLGIGTSTAQHSTAQHITTNEDAPEPDGGEFSVDCAFKQIDVP